MALAHNAVLRVHCHATEDEDKVRQALALLAGEARPKRMGAEGHFKNPIVVLEVDLKRAGAEGFWERVRAARDAALQLGAEAERRVDDRGTLFARFDKQGAFQGEVALTQGDDAIHVRSKLAVFPPDRDKAVAMLRAFLAAQPPKG